MMPGLGPSNTKASLDGPYRPNRLLDRGTRLAECTAPDNLVWQDDHLLFSSGNAVLLLDGLHDHGREPEQILRFESAVTAMAAAEDGSLAVGLGADGIAIVGGEHDGKVTAIVPGAPTALCFADPHTLFAGIVRGASGALWRIDLRGAMPLCLADELAAPNGLLLLDLDTLIVAEGAGHRLLQCDTARARRPRVLLDDLPGAPGRLAPSAGQGLWIAIPTVRGAADVGDSAGLVVRLDAGFNAETSLHGSREGRSRGAMSCLEMRGELIVACRTDGVLVAIDLIHQSES
jgi:hypothetical protein